VRTLEEWRNFVEDLKREWKTMWRDRIDDKVRAEGIANRDYSRLFVDRGTIIIATRDYKPPDFVEILEQYKPPDAERLIPPSPSVGGWRKFIRNVLSKQKRFTRRRRPAPAEPDRRKGQQLKKGGRGWLHFKWQK
jgi:hypothetical protein